MKKILAVVLFFILLFGCKSEPKPVDVKFLTSLHCDGCKQTISNKLDKLEGILKYDVEVESKIVSIQFDENTTDSVKLRIVLNDLGYTAKKIN